MDRASLKRKDGWSSLLGTVAVQVKAGARSLFEAWKLLNQLKNVKSVFKSPLRVGNVEQAAHIASDMARQFETVSRLQHRDSFLTLSEDLIKRTEVVNLRLRMVVQAAQKRGYESNDRVDRAVAVLITLDNAERLIAEIAQEVQLSQIEQDLLKLTRESRDEIRSMADALQVARDEQMERALRLREDLGRVLDLLNKAGLSPQRPRDMARWLNKAQVDRGEGLHYSE